MRRIAENLYQLRGFPPDAINVYLMGGVLIDAGTRFARRRILRQLDGQAVSAHALTHAHPDHQGSSHAVCQALGLPFWCGEADADAAENPKLMVERMPRHPLNTFIPALLAGPGHPVSRRFQEGDDVGGFVAIASPGHTAGHFSFWRESDKVLVVGDVAANLDARTGRRKLSEPPRFFSADVAGNRDSIRKLAALGAQTLCFGHGPPLFDGEAFRSFADRLPADVRSRQ